MSKICKADYIGEKFIKIRSGSLIFDCALQSDSSYF